MTAEDLAGKMAYEGGIVSGLRYGLDESDLDVPGTNVALVWAWASLCAAWREFLPLVDAVSDLLPEPVEESRA